MRSAAYPALGVPLGANTKIDPASASRKRLRRAPHQWAVATWSRGLSAEAAAGALGKLTHAGRGILRAAWDAMELESLEEMTFGVSQLATLPGVMASPDTVLRTMRRLMEILPEAADLVEAGNRGRGHQSVWRIRRPQTTWSTSRRAGIERRRAFRKRHENPQSASLPSRKRKSISSETTPTAPPIPKRRVGVAEMDDTLLEGQKELAEALMTQPSPGLNPGGAVAAAKATLPKEASVLVKAGPAFLGYLLEELKPQATKTPQALFVARLKDPRSRREFVAAGTAWIRRREAAVAAGDVTRLAGDLTPDLAVSAWKAAVGRMPAPSAAGYPAAYDLERSAWRVCLDVARREDPARASRIECQVAERIRAQGIQPGSLVWSRALAHGIARDLAEATPWLQDTLSNSRQGSGPEWARDRAGGRTGAAQEHLPHA